MFNYMHSSNVRFHFKRTRLLGAREMAQQIRAHPEDLDLIVSTHTVTDHHSELQFQGPSFGFCRLQAQTSKQNSHTHKIKIK